MPDSCSRRQRLHLFLIIYASPECSVDGGAGLARRLHYSKARNASSKQKPKGKEDAMKTKTNLKAGASNKTMFINVNPA